MAKKKTARSAQKAINEIALSDVLESIHRDLSQPRDRPGDWKPLFEVTGLDVEMTVTVKSDKQGSGGVRVYVLNVGGSAAKSTQHCHRIRLTLKAVDGNHDDVPVELLRGV